jgi:hypothetical protein
MHPKSSFILQFSSPRNFEGTDTSHFHEVHVGTESESIACVQLRQSADRLIAYVSGARHLGIKRLQN